MNILLIGSGGREHTLAWKLKESPDCTALFIAPGNAGTAKLGTNLSVGVNDFEGIKTACLQYNIGMIIVGPEDPLVNGLGNFVANDRALKDVLFFGPYQQAAELEGSKDFSKAFMKRHNIPTAAYASFTDKTVAEGVDYLQQHKLPVVLKADGLAAGKGVLICQTTDEAIAEFKAMTQHGKFGEAGKKVVIEEFLTGIEMSIFVLTDGINYVLLPEAKDYKKIGEVDTGLNTGGMGAVSPVPFFDAALKETVIQDVVEPTMRGLQTDGIYYRGVIFIGLIIEDGKAKVIEYNCRFGDPETEVIIPRLQNDLVQLFKAVCTGKLNEVAIETKADAAVAVVAVSHGYPGEYKKGLKLTIAEQPKEAMLFHAGTLEANGVLLTNGGRVMVSVGMAPEILNAKKLAVEALDKVQWEGMYFRKDIGFEFLEASKK